MDLINAFRSNCRTILYVSKILFKRFPSYLFPCYMFITYIKLQKTNKRYSAKAVPDKFVNNLVKYEMNGTFDTNNIVVLSNSLLQEIVSVNNGFLKIRAWSKNSIIRERITQVFCTDTVTTKVIILSDTLAHNFGPVKTGQEISLTLSYIHDPCLKIANEVDISLISVHNGISAVVTDGILKQYFRTPKILYKNDIVAIDVHKYGAHFYYTNKHVNEIHTIYFKCNRIKIEQNENDDGPCVCVSDETCLKQSADVQSYIPSRSQCLRLIGDEHFKESIRDALIDICPHSLDSYAHDLESAISPFIEKRQINVPPLFLIQGNQGCGKSVVVTATAAKLGLHLHKVSSNHISAPMYAQVESKLRTLFFNVKLLSPCILVITDFEDFGKNNEGQYDQRIIYNFQTEIENLYTSNNFPIIIICLSNTKHVHVDVKKLFLAHFDVDVPTREDRLKMLLWLISFKNLRTDADLSLIAGKCHGFYFEDLEALVFLAKKLSYHECSTNSTKYVLSEENFMQALDTMQSRYSQSIGAPKVPKVQWSEIGGLEEVKSEIVKTIQLPLNHPEFFKRSGLKRSGILLYGPPGTGKTLIAKAVATECTLCFLSVKGPELLNMYVGQSEQNIRQVFERAREASPCIIFFDELDSLAPNRGVSGDSGGVMDRVVSQLLAEMDGLNDTATIFIIGATNRPDLLDPALLRPGRFDKLLYVGPCRDIQSKVSVLKALTLRFNLSDNIRLEEIAESGPENVTGADYYGLCSNAWMHAVRRLILNVKNDDNNQPTADDVVVTMEDFQSAIQELKSSVKPEDLIYFEKLNEELTAKSR